MASPVPVSKPKEAEHLSKYVAHVLDARKPRVKVEKVLDVRVYILRWETHFLTEMEPKVGHRCPIPLYQGLTVPFRSLTNKTEPEYGTLV